MKIAVIGAGAIGGVVAAYLKKAGEDVILIGRSEQVDIINSKGLILYRYVEPTILTRRKPEELIAILDDLKANKLL